MLQELKENLKKNSRKRKNSKAWHTQSFGINVSSQRPRIPNLSLIWLNKNINVLENWRIPKIPFFLLHFSYLDTKIESCISKMNSLKL